MQTSQNYHNPASKESVEKTLASLRKNNFIPVFVQNKEEALEKVKSLIPDGVSIMNGSSQTLSEIGFMDLLKSGEHPWNNLHDGILAEKDPQKQAKLRQDSVISDYYIGSVHALSETGELVIASNTGSQLPHLVYTSQNIVLVVGSQKITPTLQDAITRLETYVVPLEDERMKKAHGMGTTHAKTLILHKENSFMGRKIHVVIVGEKLGF